MRVFSNRAEEAIRASWSPETAYASPEYIRRVPHCSARGQCGTTALVLNDLCGGELLVAPGTVAGVVHGVHYWNRLDGIAVDLTGEQFLPDEHVGEPQVVPRPPMPRPAAAKAAYLLLQARVFAALQPATPAEPHQQ